MTEWKFLSNIYSEDCNLLNEPFEVAEQNREQYTHTHTEAEALSGENKQSFFLAIYISSYAPISVA